MKRTIFAILPGLAAMAGVAVALASGEIGNPPDEPADDGVVLGEEDLTERAEIRRNMYRRITPSDLPIVQDVGTWPAAWEEFGPNWNGAAVEREYGAWVVPVEVEQTNGATVIRDGTGLELWRSTTDFTRPESAGVILTGGLVAEEDWARYEGVRGAVEEMTADAFRNELPSRMNPAPTSGLRFTSCEWTPSNTWWMALAYEEDTNVDLFVYAVDHTSASVEATWTNDENMVITDTTTVWYPVGEPFDGRDSTWEYLDTVAIDNGEAEYEDSGFPDNLGRARFYAAAVVEDTDEDGLSDGFEDFVTHTDADNDDSDGDGLGDGFEFLDSHTDPNNDDSDNDGVPDGEDTYPNTSNVWWVVKTTNSLYYQYFLGDCEPNAPRQSNAFWNIAGEAPTCDSVVGDVCINGEVDDVVAVDWTDVDSIRGPTNYVALNILDLIAAPTTHVFRLQLFDYPAAGYSGPNEVRIGTSPSEPFEVEWTWLVPMSLTGPEYVCVGDAVQFTAAGGGGGPYTWSVESYGLEDVAEIDEEGVLTALAPGIAFVTATAGETYSVTQAVNVVQIDFLTGGGNTPASSLKIGKWENAFWCTITTNGDAVTTNVFLKDNFIDLDPDRFKVRVVDMSMTGTGIMPIALSTISADSDLCDDPTGIVLYEEPDNSGIFVSTNQLLVADDIDDDFSNGSTVPQDDIVYDRTHKIGLGGKVHIQYPSGEEVWVQKEIEVPAEATVHIISVFLHDATLSNNDDAILSKQEIEDFLRIASKRYAQIGIVLTWDEPVICAPPSGVDLSDGLMVRTSYGADTVAPEAKAAVDGVGTPGNLTDIHLIIANKLLAGDREIGGMAVAPIRFSTDTAYQFNIFLAASHLQEWSGGSIAHELGHLLTNFGHVEDSWRLMYYTTLYGVNGTRRFVSSEENTIKGNNHVQDIGL